MSLCSQVDAHNIVPAWVASDKEEFAARTIRPKIHRHLPKFMEAFPQLPKQTTKWTASRKPATVAWEEVIRKLSSGELYVVV